MITTKPNIEPTGLYNQSNTAKILGINRHTVKRYEDDGILKFKIRKAGRQKVTTGQQILKCWQAFY